MITGLSAVAVEDLLAQARQLLAAEARALALLSDTLDHSLIGAAAALAACRGRVVVSGVGKSGIAARKLAATLASLGRPAQFLHAGDALHGDLGSLGPDDVLVAISVSGQTRELLPVVERAVAIGAGTVAITAALYAPVARDCDHVLMTECPDEDHGGSPMASTIASIALGDALAALTAAIDQRALGAVHVAGDIGRRRRSIDRVAHGGDRVPIVSLDAGAQAVVDEIGAKGFGITGVVDAHGQLVGTVSDGDLRRHFGDVTARSAAQLMVDHPVTLDVGADVGDALARMRAHRISALFVVAPGTRRVEGLVHLQDLLRVGVI